MIGTIYILTNPSFKGLIKIGHTTRNVEERVNELNSATGVPTPFHIKLSKKVSNSQKTEAELHEYLHEWRINPRKEFFKEECFEKAADFLALLNEFGHYCLLSDRDFWIQAQDDLTQMEAEVEGLFKEDHDVEKKGNSTLLEEFQKKQDDEKRKKNKEEKIQEKTRNQEHIENQLFEKYLLSKPYPKIAKACWLPWLVSCTIIGSLLMGNFEKLTFVGAMIGFGSAFAYLPIIYGKRYEAYETRLRNKWNDENSKLYKKSA